ncbi:S9 family peptidase [Luteolibacter yonseiensis]|uniref:prolyl oligopeptidase n=1 Tax=Luteolibacter yonseiensis TaxID=1144680 RepID=A0A934V856_9BACT|nr:prolyl oligopeptidase family serine peptidase [Luteolibacter yonseiensis]MBK1816892.1 S9 family peptidase [Luteolibacter yonseiensis]
MKPFRILPFLVLIDQAMAVPLPEPRPVKTDYFGTVIEDPYRYFEEKHQPQVAAWARAVSDETIGKLSKLPDRERIAKWIAEADQSQGDKVGWVSEPSPGDYYFLMRRQDDPIELLFHQKPGGRPELILDPRQVVKGDGSPVTIKAFTVSPDLKHIAVTITAGGGEMASLYVYNLAEQKMVEGPYDRARWGAAEWLPDSSGFFYTRLQKLAPDADPLETFQRGKTWYHKLGTPESADKAIFGEGVNPDVLVKPEDIVFVSPLADTGWALATNESGVSADYIHHLARVDEILSGKPRWRKICDRPDLVGSMSGGGFAIHGDEIFLLTRKDAPNGKIIRRKLTEDGLGEMKTLYTAPRGSIQNLSVSKDGIYVRTLDGGPSRLVRLPWDALDKPETITTAEEGRISLHDSPAGHPSREGVGFTLDSWTRPARFYHTTPGKSLPEPSALPQLREPGISARLVSRETMMPGHDGVMIPVSIIHRKDLPRDKTHPVMLIGYGAYGMCLEPGFRAAETALFEMGGIKVVAHVRGGGELGEEWRLAGYQKTKPNTWKDMISVAEGLVRDGLTTPGQICIHGRSAGGVTAGRALTEKPEAFGAVLIGVGLTDALRAENSPNGVPNIPEFGTTRTKPGFEALREMSAYEHVKPGVKYPPTLLYHGANDTRVELWQSLKMTARLLAAGGENSNVGLRIDYQTGHGSGASREQENSLQTDLLSFFFANCE